MLVAYVRTSGLLHFVQASPANPLRGVEYTSSLDNAQRFASLEDATAYVAARGGPVEGATVEVLAVP